MTDKQIELEERERSRDQGAGRRRLLTPDTKGTRRNKEARKEKEVGRRQD